MFFRCRAIALLIALCGAPVAGDEPILAPREGALLLRNGHVMQGNITRAGDFYVLTLGKTGEIRLPAADVEAQCVDLEDVYRYQAALLSTKKADPHLTLAEWCLRYGLKAQAEEQLQFAHQIEPENPRVAQLQVRLKVASEVPEKATPKPATSVATVSSEQLEEALKSLPKGSVEKFSVVVQPMLINRCGANGCHGPASKSDFQLLRPAAGQLTSKRFTQRNLFSVLQYIDLKNPEESRLLTLPMARHGATLSPVFDKRSQQQFDDLLAWAKHLVPEPPPLPSPPATIGESQTLLSQPGGIPNQKSATGSTPRNIAPMNTGEKPTPSHRAPAIPEAREALKPRDPFDPQVFNQKYLPGK